MKRPASIIGGLFAFLFGFAFVGIIGSCLITIGIWPGQIKWLAPIFCTDAQPDAFVVADTYSPQPGETVTNFSLYCMGPRGDSTDHGFMKPFLLISVINGIILMTLFLLLGKLGSSAVRRSTSGDGDEKIPLADRRIDDDNDPATPPFAPPTTTSDLGAAPRRPNQAPPGSTPGPFVD